MGRLVSPAATAAGWPFNRTAAAVVTVLLFADFSEGGEKKKKNQQSALLLTLSPIPVVVVGRQPPARANPVNRHFRTAHKEPSVF